MSAINERVSPKKPLFAEVHNVPDDYRFTTEELDRIISGDMFTPRQDAIIARELQQYRAAAEPVAWMVIDSDSGEKILRVDRSNIEGAAIPLYAAPQVTSVPDAFDEIGSWKNHRDTPTAAPAVQAERPVVQLPVEFYSEHVIVVQLEKVLAALAVQGVKYERRGLAKGQLFGNTEQVEHVSQPYTLPECFERLFKHAQGLTFGDDWNRGTAAKYHRDSLIKAVDDCRAAIASGNSPAIPDGWIPVSERMPGSRHAVLVGCWFGSEWTSKWATFVPGHPDAQDSGWLIPGASWTPTHWHELPAAPKQEAQEAKK